MAKTLDGDCTGLPFELDHARKDVRYYAHLANMVVVPSPQPVKRPCPADCSQESAAQLSHFCMKLALPKAGSSW